jgi:hypothetical protein
VTRFNVGDDVSVDYRGREHRGVVLGQSGQWVMCQITIDPVWDYGSVGAALDPQPTVCVQESRVKHAPNNS